MEIIFDIATKTRKIDRRMKLCFKDYYFNGIKSYSYSKQIHHLVINNKVVGVVHIDMKKSYFGVNDKTNSDLTGKCWLYCLEILRPFRGLGYSKILLQEIEKECIAKKQNEILLEVNNPIAFELYKNFGFEITDSYINSDGEQEYSMVKYLCQNEEANYEVRDNSTRLFEVA